MVDRKTERISFWKGIQKNRYPAEVLLQVLIATAIVMLEKKVRKFELVFIATKGSEGITLLMM